MASGAGLIVRARGQRWFVPAVLVHKIMAAPRLSSVPGRPIQMALLDGRVLPVFELGHDGHHLLVCHTDGEPVGLTGLEVERGGFFEADADGVRLGSETLSLLDVRAEVKRASEQSARHSVSGG